jgi:hypothetical protein
MTNAIKVLLKRQNGFLQLESTLSAIFFDQWRFFYQNFELRGSLRKFVPTFQIVAHKLK